jgi:hypothetical protein
LKIGTGIGTARFRIFVGHGSNLRCWLRIVCPATRRKRAFGLQTLAGRRKYTLSIP